MAIVPQYNQTLWLCGSKHSGTRPFFTDTCWLGRLDCNAVEAMVMGFVSSFFCGIFGTWMVHP